MKNFLEYIKEEREQNEELLQILESEQGMWTPELEEKLDVAISEFLSKYTDENGKINIDTIDDSMINEGMLGAILGGLTGFALGKAVGQTICRVLNIQPGILYDMLTSRLVGAALGAALGKRI